MFAVTFSSVHMVKNSIVMVMILKSENGHLLTFDTIIICIASRIICCPLSLLYGFFQ